MVSEGCILVPKKHLTRGKWKQLTIVKCMYLVHQEYFLSIDINLKKTEILHNHRMVPRAKRQGNEC